VADEHLIFNDHSFANEGVAGDFDGTANTGVLLNLDKRADLAVIADFAAVEIYKSEDSNVPAELDIC